MSLNTDFSQILNKIYGNSKHSKHADIFPNNIFMIIAGPTGC